MGSGPGAPSRRKETRYSATPLLTFLSSIFHPRDLSETERGASGTSALGERKKNRAWQRRVELGEICVRLPLILPRGAPGASRSWGSPGLVASGLKVSWHCSWPSSPTSQLFPAEQCHAIYFIFLGLVILILKVVYLVVVPYHFTGIREMTTAL